MHSIRVVSILKGRMRTVFALQKVGATVHDRTLKECFEGELHRERACFRVAGADDLDGPRRVGF